MKVLLVNKFHYLKGGSETYYFTLAEALQKAGHEVIFFAISCDCTYLILGIYICFLLESNT